MKSTRGSLMLSMGFVLSSIIFSLTFWHVRTVGNRYISVKGLAEREVDATVAIWTIKFEAVNDDLNQVNTQIHKQKEIIVSFLQAQGFSDKNITYGVPALDDRAKYDKQGIRYTIRSSIAVDTSDIHLAWASFQKSQELIKKGVQLTYNWEPIKFVFTQLNEIKPSMLQEATINARKAAQELASDAHIQLGTLRSATQGTFSIQDTHVPTKKCIRIVTYVDYKIK